MKLITTLIVLTFALLPGLSSAGIVYQWKAIDEKSRNVNLQMEFDTAAVASGYLDLRATGEARGPIDTGLISLSFSGANGGAYFSRNGQLMSNASINLNVTFDSGGFLGGGFYLNDGFTEIVMTSSNRFWEVTNVRSDAPMKWCGWNAPACDLGRGMMRRTDIPEPASIALLGIGLVGAAGARRRKQM